MKHIKISFPHKNYLKIMKERPLMLKWVFKILKWRMEWIMVSQWKCQETAPRTTSTNTLLILLNSSTTAKVSSNGKNIPFPPTLFSYDLYMTFSFSGRSCNRQPDYCCIWSLYDLVLWQAGPAICSAMEGPMGLPAGNAAENQTVDRFVE